MTEDHDSAPDVTVIVVGYNHSAYVVEALDSALAQT
jgi:GT2 family glycosyltransferase